MKKLVLATFAALAASAAAAPLAAQSPIPLSVEVRAGAAIPTGGDFAEHAQTGFGLGASAAVQLFPNYGLYAGYSRTQFDLDIEGARAIDSGFSVGLTAAYPGLGGITPWLGTGLLFHTLDVEGATQAEGDAQVGFEVGGGVVVPVAPRVRLTPGIAYRRYSAPFLHDTEPISYFSAGLGLNVAF